MRSLKIAFVQGALVAAVLMLTGCGSTFKYKTPGSSRAPEADARITAEVQKDQGNTKLEIKIEHLAPPERIQPGANAYVVWTRKSSDGVWMRVGALVYDADDRAGKLEASTPETKFELSITAEKNATPTSPSSDVVLTQKVGN